MDETADRGYHHGDLRSALLEAAERSVSEHGSARLSLRDLAREVGVSHAAPRRHFADRQELLDALAESGYGRLGEAIGAAAGADSPPDVRLHRAVVAFTTFATQNASLVELMSTAKQVDRSSRVARASTAAFAPILDVIRDGQSEGLLGGGPPERLGLVLYATVTGLVSMVNTGAIPAGDVPDLLDAAVAQFLRGAAP